MFQMIRADMKQYRSHGGWYRSTGFWITLLYRFGAWSSGNCPPVIRVPFHILYVFFAIPTRALSHVYIPIKAQIGGGLLLPHPTLIFVSPGSVIGNRCTLFHDVTIGKGTIPGDPRLSDQVVVFTGARVLGGVHIGNGAHIGANSVVVSDVAERATVVVSPARRLMVQRERRSTPARSDSSSSD